MCISPIFQSKQASERISIPKKFHPFICGAFNEKVNKLSQDNNVRINIPPVTVNSDELYIVGEKEGVGRVVQSLQKDHEIVVSRVASLPKQLPQFPLKRF